MKLIVTLMICLFFFGVISLVLAGAGDIDLTVEDETLSARLRGIPLKIILEKLERERGIRFRGDSSLLEEEVTVQFTQLPFVEGLKKILTTMNYSLIYGKNGKLVGVIVIGKGRADPGVTTGRDGVVQKIISPAIEQDDARGSFTVIRNIPPPGGYMEVTPEERDKFTVIGNTPPPGGPVEVSAEELENFKVIKN